MPRNTQRNLWTNEQRAFHDKAYRRASLPPWDERWHRLSHAARSALVKATTGLALFRPQQEFFVQGPGEGLAELASEGFIPGSFGRMRVRDEARDFLIRLGLLNEFRLLQADNSSPLWQYTHLCFSSFDLNSRIGELIGKATGTRPLLPHNIMDDLVAHWGWPELAVRGLGVGVARELLDVVVKADRPVRLADLPTLLPNHDPVLVRAALDSLVVHLVLFEGLDPVSLDLVVGLLPIVRAERAELLRGRPLLQPDPSPRALSSPAGTLVPDLRALLLELRSAPARLKQNGELYQGERKRFLPLLSPLPAELADLLKSSEDSRLDEAIRWGRFFELVAPTSRGGDSRLAPTPTGQDWLLLGGERQYDALFVRLREPSARTSVIGDPWFLGTSLAVGGEGLASKGSGREGLRQVLRNGIEKALEGLPTSGAVHSGVFLDWATFGPDNFLLLGRPFGQVHYSDQHNRGVLVLPALARLAREVLWTFLRQRLFPLGCVQFGLSAEGRVVVARLPRLPRYFGKQVATVEQDDTTRVIVQPDFTVMVVGLETGAASDLAPFCEHVQGRPGEGSVTYRLTRPAVTRAIAAGMPAAEVMDRLRRHASNELPGNVVHEVQGWCESVRRVRPTPAMLIHCPDSETADRAQSVLGRRASRLNETTLALAAAELVSADRNKLREVGILLEDGTPLKPATKRKRRG